MKKIVVLLCIVILTVGVLSGCSSMPFSPKISFATPPTVFFVYVCGAVANEGFVEVQSASDWATVVQQAGYIVQTYVEFPQRLVLVSTKEVVVEYFDGREVCSSTDINGALVVLRQHIKNVDAVVVNKIADYIESHGKITNKAVLRSILSTEEYENNYYKFFVSVDDYEATNDQVY